ncbi:MAG: flagellar assembly factor FliW [Pirellulaceae bacterium]|jgi:flagellar assembly factor FliW
MQLNTSRFGAITIEADDILLFPHGLIGFEEDRHWVLLADQDNPSVGWLQSLRSEELALPVVSPRKFCPDYQIRVFRSQITNLELGELDQAYILTVVNKSEGQLTTNLRAPVVINLDRRIGRQVITNDDQSTQAVLTGPIGLFRKSA